MLTASNPPGHSPRRFAVLLGGLLLPYPSDAAASDAQAPLPVGAVAAAPTAALPDELRAETQDYCREVVSAAASQRALLHWPRLFSRVGVMRGSPLEIEGMAVSPRRDLLWNLQVGVDVSPVRMHTGALLEERARVECRRHAAELELSAIEHGLELDLTSPLAARLAVLERRVPEAERQLEQSAALLEAAHQSAQSHAAIERRVEELRQTLTEAELALASRTPAAPSLSPARARATLDSLQRSEARRQELDSQLRRVEGFALDLRAGYDEVFGVQQSVPLFAFVSVQVSPASLWQSARDREVEHAHARRVERRLEQTRAALADQAARMTRQLGVVERRLQQLDETLTGLAQRREELARVGTSTAREFMAELWFDGVRLEADRAYLRALREVLVERHSALRGPAPG